MEVGPRGGSVLPSRSSWLPSELSLPYGPYPCLTRRCVALCAPNGLTLETGGPLHLDFTTGGRAGVGGAVFLDTEAGVSSPGAMLVFGWPVSCARCWYGSNAVVLQLAWGRVSWRVVLRKPGLCFGRGAAVRLLRVPVDPLPPACVSLDAWVKPALDAGGFPGAHSSVCQEGLRVVLRWLVLVHPPLGSLKAT